MQGEQEVHARAWEALKRKEREAAESTDDTLKPAASLTRVDSDTLKVREALTHRGALDLLVPTAHGINVSNF